jgi:hypothetical protein
MALKNLEETIVDRIRRAVAKELKALHRRTGTPRNGHTHNAALNRKAEVMAMEAMSAEESGDRPGA